MPDLTDTSENIVIGDRKIPTEIREIDIFELNYYPQNPRMNYVLSKYGDSLDQTKIEENLWRLDSTKVLADDIRKNGGLMEEVFVMGNQVIEGNRRLCAYRYIYRDSPAEQKENWRKIRAKVILSKISDEDLFLLLGNLHIKGKAPWDPYEKASYIYRMINENRMDIDYVAAIVGMTASAIKIQLKAYELMRDGYLPKLTELAGLDEKEQLKKFSIFEEYFKSSELQSIARENPEILSNEKFINWVLEERIRSAAYDVKKDLAEILKSKPARKEFLQSTPEDAVQAAKEKLYADRPETGDSFFKKIDEITEFIRNTKVLEIKERIKGNPRMVSLIHKFHSETEKFYRNLDIKDPNKEYIQRLRKK
ncbi:hypothetical protein HYU45_00745 [Candidatus Daviesbacteria bacterium]|nr:hypothetical protein [Candidatus Daviesbacteria bacterium]